MDGLLLPGALNNSRKTECGAKQFLARLAVRAAPFALYHCRAGKITPSPGEK
jgi:hypothetical protein